MSLEKYVTKVLQRFNMQDAKLVGSTLLTNKKLSEGQCPKTKVEKVELNKIPYASTIGSLMYTMVSIRLDIGNCLCCWSGQPFYEKSQKGTLGGV